MPTIYTIGFRQKPLKEFIGLLREAGVDAVIYIRLRNTSQLAGFAKKDDLDFLLCEGFGIPDCLVITSGMGYNGGKATQAAAGGVK